MYIHRAHKIYKMLPNEEEAAARNLCSKRIQVSVSPAMTCLVMYIRRIVAVVDLLSPFSAQPLPFLPRGLRSLARKEVLPGAALNHNRKYPSPVTGSAGCSWFAEREASPWPCETIERTSVENRGRSVDVVARRARRIHVSLGIALHFDPIGSNRGHDLG